MQVIIKNKRSHQEVARFANVSDVQTISRANKLVLLIGCEFLEFTYGEKAYFVIMGG